VSEVGSASFKAKGEFRSLFTQAKRLAAALRDVADARREASGDVELGIDAKGLKKRVKAAVEDASKGVQADIEVEPDASKFERKLRAGAEKASKRVKANVDVDPNLDRFEEQVDQQTRKKRKPIEVPVAPDTGGFNEKVKQETQKRQAPVEVPVEPKTDRFMASLTRAVKDFERRAESIKISTVVDQTGVTEGLRRLQVETASGKYTITIPADLDGDHLAAEVARQVKIAEARAGSIDVPVDAKDTGLRRKVGLMARLAGVGQKINVPVDADTTPIRGAFKGLAASLNIGALGSAIVSLLKLPAIVTGAQLLSGALSSVGSAAVGAASAVGPLLGLLATLPSLAAGIGGAVGAVKLAFMGVGDALKAYTKQQDGAGKAAASSAKSDAASAKQRQAAARQVQKAQEALGDAQKRAAELQVAAQERVVSAQRGVVDAIRRVATAERGLASAQKSSLRAQQALNDARAEAVEQLEDLRRTTARNALDEERAVLDIADARANLAKVNADPESSPEDRQRAVLDLRDAELNLLDVQDRRADDLADLNKAEKKGIENADGVIAAKEGIVDADQAVADAALEVQDANQGVLDAQVELAKAQQGIADAQVEGARMVRDAQEGVADAIQAVADAAADLASGGAGGVDAFAEAMAKLPPSAQAFVRYLISLQPLLERLKTIAADNLFPGLTVGLSNLITLMPIAERLTARFASAVGAAAADISTLALEPQFQRDLEELGNAGTDALTSVAQGAKDLFRSLVGVGAEGGNLTRWLGDYVKGLLQTESANLDAGRASGKMAEFFKETQFVTGSLLDSLVDLIHVIIDVGAEAYDVIGRDLVTLLKEGTARLREFTGSVEGKNKIRQFFEDAKPAIWEMGRLVGAVVEMFARLGANKDLAPLIKQIREDLLPVVEKLLSGDSSAFASSIIDLAKSVGELISVAGGPGGSLTVFVDTMAQIVETVAWLAEHVPGFSNFVTVLAILAGVSKAVQFTGFITGGTQLVKIFSKKNADGVSAFSKAMELAGGASKKAGQGISSALGFIAKGFASASRAIAANPIAAAILIIIAAIIVLAYVVYRNWDTIVETWNTALIALGLLWGKYGQPIVDTIVAAWDVLFAKTKEVWGKISDFLKEWWPTVVALIVGGPIGALVVAIVTHWDEIKAKTSEIWESIRAVIAEKIDAIRATVEEKIAIVRGLWDAFLAFVGAKWDAAWLWVEQRIQTAGAIISGIVAYIVGWVQGQWDSFLQFLSNTWNAAWTWIVGSASTFGEQIKAAIGDALGWVQDRWDSVWGGLSSGFSGVWSTLQQATRDGINGIISILNGLIRGANSVMSRLPGGIQISEISTRFAEGGEVPGRGQGDTVPAMLTPKEYVNTVDTVRREGVGAFHALNRGMATITPIDQARRKKYAKGGQVGRARGTQRFAKGGVVKDVLSLPVDIAKGSAAGATSALVKSAWSAAKAAATTALDQIPARDKIPGAVGAASGARILQQVDKYISEQTVNLDRAAVQAAVDIAKLAAQAKNAASIVVRHQGGGVGINPSTDVLALLQRGEGVMSAKAVGAAEQKLSTGGATRSPVGNSTNHTVINIEINNPVGETSEQSLHRSLQKLAVHGVLPDLGETA